MESQIETVEDEQGIEDEKLEAIKLLNEMKTRIEQRKNFRNKNLCASDNRPNEDELRRLDGSIKKNTAFCKKLRELTESKRDSLTNEFKNLNLTKYIQEAATNIVEAKLKLSDVNCAVHMCSLLHCHYESFSELLLDQLQKCYSTKISKDDDKTAVSTKYRLGLRLIGELVISGIINEDIGIALLHDMLTDIIKCDRNDHHYIAVVVGFARHCAEDIAGVLPRKQKLLWNKYGFELPQISFLSTDKQSMFRELLINYFQEMSKHLIREHKEMHLRTRKDVQILQNKGELSSERQESNEKFRKNYEKLTSNLTTLSVVLDQDMPDLPEDQTPQEVSDISIDLQLPSLTTDEQFSSTSLWEDEDQRSFYEDITDIKPYIPAILLEGHKRSQTDSESSDTSAGEVDSTKPYESNEESILEEIIKETENLPVEEEDIQPLEDDIIEEVHESSEISNLDAILFRLPNMMNRKFVDDIATDFCLINSKFNRNKLAKALFNVDKNRMDLVPFYARLLATLHPCLPDITPLVVDMLLRDFKFQLRKKDQIHIHTKMKNARFIAEMTKFGILPKPEAMRCITRTLQDFTHHNIELACTLIEHCGRYLLRSPDSHLRAKALLEIIFRKKQVQHLDGRQKAMVEDALYAANPPDIKANTGTIIRPPLQAYIHKLLYKDLNKLNIEKILKQFRKLPWDDPEVFGWAVEALSQIWLIKFSNIHCIANLLAGLKQYQDEPVVWIIDSVLEDIRFGLETNVPQMNQRRVSVIKFLGELYNYQLIESNVIFRTLYTLLTFGYDQYGSAGSLDTFDSYFRARLVCVLLDTCGVYFDHGSSKKKLDAFLIVFQCYLLKKRQPLPLEVEYMVIDTLVSLRPSIVLYNDVSEANEALSELEKKFRSKLGDTVGVDEIEEDSDEEDNEYDVTQKQNDDDDEESADDDNDQENNSSDEDMISSVLKGGPEFIPCPEDDDFISVFDKMMNETRKIDNAGKVPSVDIAIPMHLRKSGGDQKPKSSHGQMKFTLVMKKGHKQQLKELNVPVESELASNLQNTQQALKQEKDEMKRIILSHNKRQEEEEDYEATIKQQTIPVKHPAYQQTHYHSNRPKQKNFQQK